MCKQRWRIFVFTLTLLRFTIGIKVMHVHRIYCKLFLVNCSTVHVSIDEHFNCLKHQRTRVVHLFLIESSAAKHSFFLLHCATVQEWIWPKKFIAETHSLSRVVFLSSRTTAFTFFASIYNRLCTRVSVYCKYARSRSIVCHLAMFSGM